MTSSNVLLGFAVLLLGGAVIAFLQPSRSTSGPTMDVTPLVVDLGTVPPGPNIAKFTVTNSGEQPRRVLGLSEGCGPNCCFNLKETYPVPVPPSESIEYPCLVTVDGSGPFEATFVLYLEDNGIREVTVSVRGVGVAVKEKAATATDH